MQKTAKLETAVKSLSEKSCEIKGGSYEMAAMMLIIIIAYYRSLTSL